MEEQSIEFKTFHLVPGVTAVRSVDNQPKTPINPAYEFVSFLGNKF